MVEHLCVGKCERVNGPPVVPAEVFTATEVQISTDDYAALLAHVLLSMQEAKAQLKDTVVVDLNILERRRVAEHVQRTLHRSGYAARCDHLNIPSSAYIRVNLDRPRLLYRIKRFFGIK